MKSIYEIIASVQSKISFYLALSGLITILIIAVIQIKISTEMTVRMVGADQNAFIHGLDEAILFNDYEGQKLILNWLKQRHYLLDAAIVANSPRCDLLKITDDFFEICWTTKKYVTAYHRVRGENFLAVKSPIKFDFDKTNYLIILIIIFIFLSFSLIIRSIFSKLARSVHEPIVSLAGAVVDGTPIDLQQNIFELKTLAETLVSVREIERQRVVNEVAQSLTHDLRNELGVFEFLARIQSFQDFKSWKSEALSALARSLTIIGKIGVTNMDQTLEIITSRLDLMMMVRDVQRNSPDINIKVESSWSFAEVFFKIDPVAINRVIVNLVKNSVESGAKNIDVIGRLDGVDLYISVVDDGPGVPNYMQGRLFQRGESYGKPQGHGLGLYNVRVITEGHGGSVNYLRSGHQSIFELRLPTCLTELTKSDGDTPEPKEIQDINRQKTLLVVIRNPLRQSAILQQMVKYPVKIYLEEAGGGLFPSVLLTDDPNIVERYLDAKVPIVMDNGKDDPEMLAKQLVRRFRMIADLNFRDKDAL